MGAVDVERQKPNVFRMKLLGAKVNAVTSGAQTLKDAMNEALRDWVANVRDTYYIIGTAAGPHPYPAMVRDFQSRDRPRGARADAGGGGPPARHARRLHRRRLQRHRPVPSLPRRQGRGDLRRGGGRPRPRRAERALRLASPAASPACCTATAPICCRTTTARSSRAIRSRPASTIRASGPSTPGSRRAGRVTYVAITDKEALDAFQLCTQARRHHPGAGAGARAGLRRQARADAAQGQPAGHEHVRPRRQGHLRRRRAPRHEDVNPTPCLRIGEGR